jgi:hypothetical protein
MAMMADSLMQHVRDQTKDLLSASTPTVTAEIHILEPVIGPDGQNIWREITPPGACVQANTGVQANAATDARRAAAIQEITAMRMDAFNVVREAIKAQPAIEQANAAATTAAREAFAKEAMKAATSLPALAAEQAAAQQALAPPVLPARPGFLGWLCGKCRPQSVISTQVTGPTTAVQR